MEIPKLAVKVETEQQDELLRMVITDNMAGRFLAFVGQQLDCIGMQAATPDRNPAKPEEALKRLPDKMENRDWAIEYADKAGVVENLDERNRLIRAFDEHLDWIKEKLGV